MIDDNRNLENDDPNAITDDDRAVADKKSISSADIKSAFSDNKIIAPGRGNARLFGPSMIILFSVLMVASGLMIALLTYYSIIGIIFGILMILVGIFLPFGASGRRTQSQ